MPSQVHVMDEASSSTGLMDAESADSVVVVGSKHPPPGSAPSSPSGAGGGSGGGSGKSHKTVALTGMEVWHWISLA